MVALADRPRAFARRDESASCVERIPSCLIREKLDLEALIQALVDAEVEFIVVGGAAAVLHGAPTITQDGHGQRAQALSYRLVKTVAIYRSVALAERARRRFEELRAKGKDAQRLHAGQL